MTWLDTPIDGQQSVAANKTPINNAFTYIANSMKIDHFWDDTNANLDGHHQWVQMPKNESGGSPANPSIATDMDGVFFVKDKTTTEVPDGDTIVAEPFYIVNDGANDQVLQLGVRAMGHFEVAGGVLSAKYLHNCTVARTAAGLFTVTFTVALPSDNYMVMAGGIRSASAGGNGNMKVQANATKSNVMTNALVKLEYTRETATELVDPIAGWFAVIGG